MAKLEGINIKVGIENIDETEELYRSIADAIKTFKEKTESKEKEK